jgi:hypothetical protein
MIARSSGTASAVALATALAFWALLPACSTGEEAAGCTTDADCGGHKCENGTCSAAAAVCTSAGRPGNAPACDGEPCTAGTGCASTVCTSGKCAPSKGKTCGVGLPNPCNAGDECQQDSDCTSDYCDAKCADPPANVHTDGRRNGGETGIDCGGTSNVPCPAQQACKTNDDCQSTCNANGNVCDAPSATDGKKNQDETDIDCGGANAPKCLRGKACKANSDCQLDACGSGGTCGQPSATDGVKNGSETDVDCGGAGVSEADFTYQAPRCIEGKGCAAATDCTPSHGCSPKGICSIPSCATTETAGIVTCGEGESDDPKAKHEDCCRSLTLPTSTNRRLDKYEITAGRMRTFVTQVGPNVRAWVANYVKANPSSQLAKNLAAFPVLADLYPAAERGENLSLTAHLSHDIDNYGGNRGCYNGAGDYSANTYWMDADHYADFGLPPRALDRLVSDEKPLNCQMPLMMAAFCAWDGGELATMADFNEAWGPDKYPWGPSVDRSEYNWCNGPYENGGFKCQCDGVDPPTPATPPCPPGGFSFNGEAGVFYEYPVGTDRSLDNEPLIAAPGRFPNDATTKKSNGESWHDLGGNLAEFTGDWAMPPVNPAQPPDTTFCDLSGDPVGGHPTCTRPDGSGVPGQVVGPGTQYTGIPYAGMVGDTWEGHQYGRGVATGWMVTGQYGKFGGRCVRPVE